jgi:uncharacterized membrane protein
MSAATYRLLNLLLLGAMFAGSMMVYPSLPERFPRHFGLSGQPDAWMKRSVLSWLMLPLVAAAMAALLNLAARASARNPSLWNVPDKKRFLALTEAERAPIHRHLEDFMALVGLVSTALLMVVQASIYDAATSPTPTVPRYLFAAVAVHLIVLLVAGRRLNTRVAARIADAYRQRPAR